MSCHRNAGKNRPEIGLPAVIWLEPRLRVRVGDVELWAFQRGVTLEESRPTDNAYIAASMVASEPNV